MFRLSEESTAKHVKHRIYDGLDAGVKGSEQRAEEEQQADDASDSGGDSGDDDAESQKRSNPLQSAGAHDAEDVQDEEAHEEVDEPAEGPEPLSKQLHDLDLAPDEQVEDKPTKYYKDEEPDQEDEDADPEDAETSSPKQQSSTPGQTPSGTQTPSSSNQPQKKPLPRGKRSKAKKLAAKYKYEDEEDRALREALTGTAVARQRAAEEAAAKAAKAAEAAAAAERKKQAEERRIRQAAEHEEVRRVMLEEGVDVLDSTEQEQVGLADLLIGSPLPGDEILEIVPVCAPWAALARCKYKAKIQPGSQKKGKAVKEIVERWRFAGSKKSVVDENARDPQRMWPREVELIKALKTEEAYNCVPVRTVRVMLAGGGAGGGSGPGSSGGGGGKGSSSGGGKGKKQRGQKK
jgi:nuclear export mediator factor NEMF